MVNYLPSILLLFVCIQHSVKSTVLALGWAAMWWEAAMLVTKRLGCFSFQSNDPLLLAVPVQILKLILLPARVQQAH